MTPSKDDASDVDGSAGLDDLIRAVARSPARPPAPELFPGGRWGATGRYVIERRLGAGGMGTVYQAKDELLAKTVALKVLNRRFNPDEESDRSRLLAEARIAARVEHERVARVYDVGEHEGAMFLVLEFVEGPTLRHWMRQCRVVRPNGERISYGVRHFREIIISLAEGLSVLHEQAVVHRDLKPEDVVLARGLKVKLLDFGLARQVFDMEGCDNRSRAPDGKSSAAWSGTLGYIAPERFEGAALRPTSDVFSLGVIIYEFLTGWLPFGGDRPMTFLEATRRPPDFSVGSWHRFSSLKDLTVRMLSRNPEERFANGTEALRALRYELDLSQFQSNIVDEGTKLEGVILWVDDEPEKDAREIATLESIGLSVMTLRSTKEALAAISRIESESRVAVISDGARAEGPREGYVLLDAMRSRGDSTPFFIYSSSAVEEDRRETLEHGGQGCTSDDQELFAMVIAEFRRRH
jgi:serine/threonine protein kinase